MCRDGVYVLEPQTVAHSVAYKEKERHSSSELLVAPFSILVGYSYPTAWTISEQIYMIYHLKNSFPGLDMA